MFRGNARILVRGGGRTSDKISYMISSQVLYCNAWGPPRIKIWGGVTSDNINTQYIYCIQGRRQNFGGGGGTSEKISYMISFQVLYCNGVSKISVGRKHSAQIYSSKTFEKL